MAKQEMCREITAEQAYQEDLLEHEYRTSGTPDFVKRADFMNRTFQTRLVGENLTKKSQAVAQNTEGVVFEL